MKVKKLFFLFTVMLIFSGIFTTGIFAQEEYNIVPIGENTYNVTEKQIPEETIDKPTGNDTIDYYPGPLAGPARENEEVLLPSAVNTYKDKVSAGMHSAIIKNDNSLWVWGSNDEGEIGDGTKTTRPKPVKVLDDVAKVSLGYENSAAIKNDGSLWMWGANKYGQLGIGNTTGQTTPVKVLDGVKKVSIGANHTAAIKDDGSLWLWGNNYYGQIGLGHTGNVVEVGPDGSAEFTPYILKPTKIVDSGVADVSLGYGFTTSLNTDGTVDTWGNNEDGQLGTGSKEDVLKPRQILQGVQAISAGYSHNLCLKDKNVLSWGLNDEGELGNGTTSEVLTPTQISGISGIESIATGAWHNAAIDANGNLYTWGYNSDGRLADGSTSNKNTPTKVSSDVDTAALGLYQTLVIKKDGSLWGAGSNKSGELGNGTTNDSHSLSKILDNTTPDSSYSPDNYTGTFIFDRVYSPIREELDMINAERAKVGSSPIQLDESLTETAMERAGEISLNFAHERPDGQICFTANSKMEGENVAVNQRDVADVMDSWMHSDGHRRNILDPEWKSVGIGFVKADGANHFVQCFSSRSASGTPKSTDETVTQQIKGFKNQFLKEVQTSDSNTNMQVGDTKQIKMLAKVNNTFQTLELPLVTTSVKSSMPDVLTVTGTSGTDPNITLKALKSGKSQVSLNSDTLKKDIEYTVGQGQSDQPSPSPDPEPDNQDSEITNITLDKSSLTIKAGESVRINPTVTPVGAVNRSLEWSSSDAKIATVSNGLITGISAGQVTITVKAKDNPKVSATCSVNVTAATQPSPNTPNTPNNPDTPTPENPVQPEPSTPVTSTVGVNRLYNKVSQEHLYTTSDEEVLNLILNPDWTYENKGWYAPNPNSGNVKPVYRLYNPALGEHLYTTDDNEVRVLTTERGWSADFNGQPLFYSGGSIPVYRLYNEALGRHHLTTDENEYNTLAVNGWNAEGAALYAAGK